MASDGDTVLTSAHVLEYPYARSVGPVVGAFLAGLRDGKILGATGSDGGVVVPPTEYDPTTAEPTGDLVEVGPEGTVESWAWVDRPAPQHPLDRPFAWALVRLDGAATAMLHVLDAGDVAAVSTGMRVRAEFADERSGRIQDIRAFVPADSPVRALTPADADGPVTTLPTPMRLDYTFSAGVAQSRNLHGLAEGRFVGQRCPVCSKVYVPSRGSCPVDGVPTDEEVALGNTGTVTTFCVVNVPFAGQSVEIPYICAMVLLDGADISFMGLIQEIPTDEVRMGLRVEAVWVEPDQLGPSMASVRYFRPTGEPDADYETYKDYT